MCFFDDHVLPGDKHHAMLLISHLESLNTALWSLWRLVVPCLQRNRCGINCGFRRWFCKISVSKNKLFPGTTNFRYWFKTYTLLWIDSISYLYKNFKEHYKRQQLLYSLLKFTPFKEPPFCFNKCTLMTIFLRINNYSKICVWSFNLLHYW